MIAWAMLLNPWTWSWWGLAQRSVCTLCGRDHAAADCPHNKGDRA